MQSIARLTTRLCVVFTLSLLSACESMADSGGDLSELSGKRWIAEAIDGQDVVDGSRVTLEIKGDRVSGKAGCNTYGGTAAIDGRSVKFGALFSTKMACMARGVMEQERRFLNALQHSVYGQIEGGQRLTITTEDGGTVVFRVEAF